MLHLPLPVSLLSLVLVAVPTLPGAPSGARAPGIHANEAAASLRHAAEPKHDTVPAWLLGSWSGMAYNHMDSADQCPFQMTVVRGLEDSHIMYYRTEDWYCFHLKLMAAGDSSALFSEGPAYGYSNGKLRRIGGTLLAIRRGADRDALEGFYYTSGYMRTLSRFDMKRIGEDQRVYERCQ